MRLALSREVPSQESELVAKALGTMGDVVQLDPWNLEACASRFDVAVCVGPVAACPVARGRVLVALGCMASQRDLGWDVVVVSSRKAARLAGRMFGVRTGVVMAQPPVLGLHHGRRRLVTPCAGLLHASEFGFHAPDKKGALLAFGLWADREATEEWACPPSACEAWPESCEYGGPKKRRVFSPNDFNSAVRGGAIGLYPEWMADGYDLQVRRHLCLGGRVMCRRDPEVLGDLADLCSEATSDMEDANRNDPVDCSGDADAWVEAVCDVARRV